jgi:hypothetical protein
MQTQPQCRLHLCAIVLFQACGCALEDAEGMAWRHRFANQWQTAQIVTKFKFGKCTFNLKLKASSYIAVTIVYQFGAERRKSEKNT